MVRNRRTPSSSKAKPPPEQRSRDEEESKENETEKQDANKQNETIEQPAIADVAGMVPPRREKRSSAIGKFLKKSTLNIR